MKGSGTLGDPYIIENATDLQAMEVGQALYYELGCDIDCKETRDWNSGEGFNPIGNFDAAHPEYAFAGNFDGKGHTISNLYINRPNEDYVALFGMTDAVGALGHDPSFWIKDANFKDCEVHGDYYSIGIVAGYNDYGISFDNVHLTDCTIYLKGWRGGAANQNNLVGLLAGSTYTVTKNCSARGTIQHETGEHRKVNMIGLLLGYQGDGQLYRCYAIGSMTLSCDTGYDAFEVGGLAGEVTATSAVEECFSDVDIVITGSDECYGIGGLIGYEFGSTSTYCILNCYARGNITVEATGTYLKYVGTLAGYAGGDDRPIKNSYGTGLITLTGVAPQTYIGGCVGIYHGASTGVATFWDKESSGISSDSYATGLTTRQSKNRAEYKEADWDFKAIWSLDRGCNDSYPCLLEVTPLCSRWAGNILVDQQKYHHYEEIPDRDLSA